VDPLVRHLTPRDYRPMPWRNGQGVTTEIARGPEGDGPFDWRISAAPVVEPGAFSTFPGVDRILVVIEGTGLSLAHAESGLRVDLRPLRPYAFSGDATTTCTLPAGPVRDLGVMVRRDRFQARVLVLRPTRPRARVVRAPLSLVYCVRGRAALHVGDQRLDLRREEAVRIERAPGPAPSLTVAPRSHGTVLLLALLQPTPEAAATS
jgi:environmental stress-induced protein Ves